MITGDTIQPGGLQRGPAKQVTPTDNQANLDANADQLTNL
jgi:hypothetical protein